MPIEELKPVAWRYSPDNGEHWHLSEKFERQPPSWITEPLYAHHTHTPTAADTGLAERLTAELERTKQQRQMLQGNVEDLERAAEQREAAARKQIADLERTIAENSDHLWYKREVGRRMELAAAREQIAALEREVWRLQSKLSEVFDYDARDSAK